MTTPTDLYRVRSFSERLRDALDPAAELTPTPVLLHVMTQVEYWAKQTLRTMALGDDHETTSASGRWRSPSLLVMQVSPRPRSARPERIIVGRSARADVCLPYPRVSKHHAYFTDAGDGRLSLVDLGSTNGTFLHGERLAEGAPALLDDDCIIFFGKYETRYMAAERFQRHLESVGARDR